jgi:hypothetical protein
MGHLRFPILLFCTLLASLQSRAQDRLPLIQSEYMPFLSAEFNPALAVDPKVYLSIHLAGANMFALNDLAFYEGKRFNLPDLFSGRLKDSDENLASYAKSATMDVRIEGPAAYLSVGLSSFGISTRIRNHFYARDVAPELSRFVFHGFRFSPQYDQAYKGDGSIASFMSWGELELTWAHMVRLTEKDHLNFGIGLKRLYGLGHVGLNIDAMDFRVTSQDIFINDFSGSYAVSDFTFRGGNGWGTDLGAVYKRMKNGRPDYIPFNSKSSCRQSAYKYMVGLSITDLGRVNFKTNAFKTNTSLADVVWLDYINTEVSELEQLDSLLQVRVENDQNITTRESSYKVKLPRAINIHGDYDFEKGIHLSAAMVLPWKGAKEFDLARASSFSVTPRYVRKIMEVGLPLSLVNYDTFRVGLGLRFQYFYLGSDDLFRLFDGEDVYGTDVYVGMHIPIYSSKSCGSSSNKRNLIAPCWGQ